MDPQLLAAQFVTGAIGPEDLPDHMTNYLIDGLGDMAVAELAGLSDVVAINELAPSAFAELGVTIPTKSDDIWTVARYLAAEVLADRVAPVIAARTLIPMVSEDFEDPDELLNFRYVGFEWADQIDTPDEADAVARAACARLLAQ